MSTSSSKFVRASKFRHVFGEAAKSESQYSDLELSPVTGDHNYIRGNSKFFSVAVRGGGGPVVVIPYSLTGKLPRGYPTINGHSAAVYDTAFNPFNDNVLATGSDDTTIKLWHIPDGGLTETLRDPLITLSGHGKPVALLAWHPTANNVLASAGKDPCVKIWDVENGTARQTLEGFGGLIQDFNFNTDGSLMAISTKDKLARLMDPRSGSAVSEWTPHEGGKAFKILFLGDRRQILTAGFTKQSKREFKIWDMDRLGGGAEPIATQEVDQQAGVMIPFYDDDTRMLYLTGKGDGNIRYYEFVDEAPFVYFLSEHRTNVSTKGADMLPKRACNVLRCEVARFLKLTADSVEPISFIVPRKSEAFQEDIFPDALAGKPALTAADWFAGKTAAPLRVSLDPARGGAVTASAGAGTSVYRAPPAASPAPAAHSPAPAATHTPAHQAPAASPANTGAGAAAVAEARAPAATRSTSTSTAHTVGGSDSAAPGVDAKAFAALEAQVRSLTAELTSVKERLAALEAGQGSSAPAAPATSPAGVDEQ